MKDEGGGKGVMNQKKRKEKIGRRAGEWGYILYKGRPTGRE